MVIIVVTIILAITVLLYCLAWYRLRAPVSPL
jgi:hypothetical protein